MKILDLRSDTVTQPTPAMRLAMADALLGDDGYGDDPSVNELERVAAEQVGKAAALFVPSGTFANQLAIFTHCQAGNEIIAGDDCHIVQYEVGAAAVISGVQLRTIESQNGVMDAAQIRRKIRHGVDIHEPSTALICVENAHSNGRVLPLSTMQDIWQVAQAEKIALHLDGARVFNAATALGVDVREITQYCDTLMFCLSKGLAAPIGSLLVGSSAFIAQARKKRKLLGGAMRQVGVLAAPGLIALQTMPQRLAIDHHNALALARQLADIDGIAIDLAAVEINMLWLRFTREIDVTFVMDTLSQAGIKANPPEHGWMRLMTHWQIESSDLPRIVAAMAAGIR